MYVCVCCTYIHTYIHTNIMHVCTHVHVRTYRWLIHHLGGFFVKRRLDSPAGRDILYRKCLHEVPRMIIIIIMPYCNSELDLFCNRNIFIGNNNYFSGFASQSAKQNRNSKLAIHCTFSAVLSTERGCFAGGVRQFLQQLCVESLVVPLSLQALLPLIFSGSSACSRALWK